MRPRIRTVKPELFKHEALFELERSTQLPVRLGFIALLCCCDREGRFEWRPQRLQLDMLPYDENIDLSKVLNALCQAGFIEQYVYEGAVYGCIPSWLAHQRINNREPESVLPPPPRIQKVEIPLKAQTLEAHRAMRTDPLRCEALESKSMSSHPAALELDHAGACGCMTPGCMSNAQACISNPGARISGRSEEIAVDSGILGDLFEIQQLESTSVLLPSHESLALKDTGACTRMTLAGMSPAHACISGRGMGREGEEEMEEEQEQERKGSARGDEIHALPVAAGLKVSGVVQQIFEQWKMRMHHPEAQLDSNRKTLIQKALGLGYSATQLCEAIRGCSLTPHNQGQNDRGQRYDGLHIIFKNADQIDRFIHNAKYPPRILSASERRVEANVQRLKAWVDGEAMEVQSYETH